MTLLWGLVLIAIGLGVFTYLALWGEDGAEIPDRRGQRRKGVR